MTTDTKKLRQLITTITRTRDKLLALVREEKHSAKVLKQLTGITDDIYYTLDTVAQKDQ